MSKLNDLIQQLCPDGVPFSKLEDVIKIVRGERITKKDIMDEGHYYVMSGGTKPMGYFDKYNREADTITISSYGAALELIEF